MSTEAPTAASPETVALQMPSSSGNREGPSGSGAAHTDSSKAGGSADRTNKESVTKKPSVTIREPPRSQRSYSSGYTIVKIEEKHGPLHRAIPCMPLPLAVLCCMLNIVAPGIGTLISSFTVFCCATSKIEKTLHAFLLNLLSALLQIITFLFIVGWIWSILWGMTFVQLALSAKEAKPTAAVPYYVRRQSSVE